MLQNVAISALRVKQGGPPQCVLFSSPSERRQSPYQPSSAEAGLLIHNHYYYTAADTSLSRSSSLTSAGSLSSASSGNSALSSSSSAPALATSAAVVSSTAVGTARQRRLLGAPIPARSILRTPSRSNSPRQTSQSTPKKRKSVRWWDERLAEQQLQAVTPASATLIGRDKLLLSSETTGISTKSVGPKGGAVVNRTNSGGTLCDNGKSFQGSGTANAIVSSAKATSKSGGDIRVPMTTLEGATASTSVSYGANISHYNVPASIGTMRAVRRRAVTPTPSKAVPLQHRKTLPVNAKLMSAMLPPASSATLRGGARGGVVIQAPGAVTAQEKDYSDYNDDFEDFEEEDDDDDFGLVIESASGSLPHIQHSLLCAQDWGLKNEPVDAAAEFRSESASENLKICKNLQGVVAAEDKISSSSIPSISAPLLSLDAGQALSCAGMLAVPASDPLRPTKEPRSHNVVEDVSQSRLAPQINVLVSNSAMRLGAGVRAVSPENFLGEVAELSLGLGVGQALIIPSKARKARRRLDIIENLPSGAPAAVTISVAASPNAEDASAAVTSIFATTSGSDGQAQTAGDKAVMVAGFQANGSRSAVGGCSTDIGIAANALAAPIGRELGAPATMQKEGKDEDKLGHSISSSSSVVAATPSGASSNNNRTTLDSADRSGSRRLTKTRRSRKPIASTEVPLRRRSSRSTQGVNPNDKWKFLGTKPTR